MQTLFAAAVNDGYVEYQNGNNQQAIKYLKKPAIMVHPLDVIIGLMYYSKFEVEQEYFKAAEAFAKACDDGHEKACYNLAYMYQNGYGVKLDAKKH